KGDIYGATGKYQEAISSYRLAIDEVKTNGMGNLFLEMKTNELASKNQSVITDEKNTQSA
ncbi:MAG: tetratricopeptide repeat protein, partial [Gammaproteobacteria bacterium]|nr:tetratricopeptide repeat protein [Gammaproteobacteria bacterium]